MSEEIVRFIMVRPPEPARRQLVFTPSAGLLRELEAAARGAGPAGQLAAVAAKGRSAAAALPLMAELVKLAALLRAAATPAAGEAAVTKTLGPANSPARRELSRTVEALEDLVACQKYSGQSAAGDGEEQESLRAALVMKHEAFTVAKSSPKDMMSWPLVVAAAPRVRAVPAAAAPAAENDAEAVSLLRTEIAEHQSVLMELEEFSAQDFEEEDDERPAPPESARLAGRLLSARARARLSAGAVQVLQARKLNLETEEIVTAERSLAGHLQSMEQQRLRMERRLDPPPVTVRMAGGLYEISPSALQAVDVTALTTVLPAVPGTHGEQISVGVGDLLVVRQQLTRYEAADISHVDNAMRGEHRSREHKRGRITEQTTAEETETTRTEERDQQSTDRNELQRETASALSEQLSMKLASSVSGSYGPSVQFSMNAGLAMDSAKESSAGFAQTISKEATQRAATKISERIKRSSSLKITDTVEETNIHEVDNKAGAAHVTGIYQWLDKVQEARVFNYGVRLMFDLMLPEPAALLLHTAAEQPAPGAKIKKPVPFTLTADQMHEWNYALHAQEYDAGGLEPPPEQVRSVSKVLEGMDENEERGWAHQTADLPIPEGYEARKVRVATAFGSTTAGEPGSAVEVLAGGVRLRLHKGKLTGAKNLNSEQGSIAVAMHSFKAASVVVTVTVDCRRTKRAVSAWRLATHAAIKQGYLKQMQDYEVKLARAKAEAAAVAAATAVRPTPELIQNELKRAAISVLTRQHFSLFNSITEGKAMPHINFDQLAAEGPYIRFFEQAFEWEQATHVFYPYFWGRRKMWKARLALGADDPEFARFLKAGAARLVLPVRREFERGILHFLETGQVWQGGEPPDITSPQYVHIVDEIREQTGAPGAEVPVGEPWTVRLPTTLIKIRAQSTLPAWSKQPDGSWAPVD